MKIKNAPLVVAVCISILLTGCGAERQQGTHLSLQPTDNMQSPQATNHAGSNTPNESALSNSLTFEIVPNTPESGDLVSGKLLYTVTGARVITSQADIPEGGFDSEAYASFYPSAGQQIMCYYPDFIQADGSFMDGIYLVLVDMTVESQDATNKTSADADENGNFRGKFDTPYIFRADSFFYLIDSSKDARKTSESMAATAYQISFFSLFKQRDEHRFAFELLPGESKSFTIGYLVGDCYTGRPTNLADLALCRLMNDPTATFIHLNLGDS